MRIGGTDASIFLQWKLVNLPSVPQFSIVFLASILSPSMLALADTLRWRSFGIKDLAIVFSQIFEE